MVTRVLAQPLIPWVMGPDIHSTPDWGLFFFWRLGFPQKGPRFNRRVYFYWPGPDSGYVWTTRRFSRCFTDHRLGSSYRSLT